MQKKTGGMKKAAAAVLALAALAAGASEFLAAEDAELQGTNATVRLVRTGIADRAQWRAADTAWLLVPAASTGTVALAREMFGAWETFATLYATNATASAAAMTFDLQDAPLAGDLRLVMGKTDVSTTNEWRAAVMLRAP